MPTLRQLMAVVSCFACLTTPLYPVADRATAADAQSQPWLLRGLDGSVTTPFADTETRAIVLVFISTDCPIANVYHPRLKEIEREFRDQGIAFFLVHSTADITTAAAQSHADDFDLSIPVILDSDQVLARRADAKVTPEAIVIARGDVSPVYHGAIDNLFEGYGKKRRRANKHYLKDALEQWLAGKEIAVPSTKPIGCYISYTNR